MSENEVRESTAEQICYREMGRESGEETLFFFQFENQRFAAPVATIYTRSKLSCPINKIKGQWNECSSKVLNAL